MKELRVGESVVVRCVKQGKTACVSEDGRVCDFYNLEDCAGLLGCGSDMVFVIDESKTPGQWLDTDGSTGAFVEEDMP